MVAPDALATVDRKAPFLKVHMRDGSAYVLSSWTEAAFFAVSRLSGK